MTDSLRTRIATAIMQSCHGVYLDDAVAAADKVIRELDMVKEDGECSYCYAQLPGCRYSIWADDGSRRIGEK